MIPDGAVQVLDHGYVKLVESWGSDERIIEAARMSTDKGFQGWGPVDCSCIDHPPSIDGEVGCRKCGGTTKLLGDEKLLRYLWEHKHATPFEMAGLIVEVQAPIFVFREWHRHRTQSYNELSARYTALPDLFYVPSLERIMSSRQSAANKQSSEAGIIDADAISFRGRIEDAYRQSRRTYENLLACGVAREVARVVIPVAQFSRMRASANLRNWLAFLTLRMDPSAQWEIRQYANEVGQLIAKSFPRTWEIYGAGK